MRILVDGQTLSTADIKRGIGEYLLNILSGMIKIKAHDTEIFLAVRGDYDHGPIAHIVDEVKVVEIDNDGPSRSYVRSIIENVKKYDIDIYWIPNPLMPNVDFIDDRVPCKVVTTVYDLIPLVMKSSYLDRWPAAVAEEYKGRTSRLGRVSDRIISISESTKKDLVDGLSIDPAKVRTIYLGSKVDRDGLNEGQDLREKYGDGRFILYPGGFDPRKNMEKAILAFKKLLEYRRGEQLQLVIACSCDEDTKKKFVKFLSGHNVDDRVKLTGYVPESELLWLYDHASILFFPSLYEGFGLPVVEAMSRGAPVVASNRSSMPEVIGDAGVLVDPENIVEMANALDTVLSDAGLEGKLRARSRERSGLFSWEKASRETLDTFNGLFAQADTRSCRDIKARIAYFSPLPPQRSGIAAYSDELLQHLKKYAVIDIFLDDGIDPEPAVKGSFKCYSYRDYEKLLAKEKYDTTIYHMGNNVIHEYIYKTLLEHPGITVLHDFTLHPFIQIITALNGDPGSYISEMKYAYGAEGEQKARSYVKDHSNTVDYYEYPLNEHIIDSSRRVIVHSYYAKYLTDRRNVSVIPLGRDPVDLDRQAISEYKKAFGLEENYPIIGCYGFMNFNKRLDVVIEVFKSIVNVYPGAMLLLAGNMEVGYRRSLAGLIKKYGLNGNVAMTGYVDEETYRRYIACADIVVNLRYPTMGETSATLLDAMAFGKPVIVTNIGSYTEYPDRCCWKVDVDADEKELLKAYLIELAGSKDLREAMGRSAREYIRKNHRWEKVAIEYINMINGLKSDDG